MKLLLDTYVWIWALFEPQKLSPRVRAELSEEDNDLWLSPISVWEFSVLVRKGRYRLERDFNEWLDESTTAVPLRQAPITIDVARRVDGIGHKDPADAFLVATAQTLDLTLVTSDRKLLALDNLETLRAS